MDALRVGGIPQPSIRGGFRRRNSPLIAAFVLAMAGAALFAHLDSVRQEISVLGVEFVLVAVVAKRRIMRG